MRFTAPIALTLLLTFSLAILAPVAPVSAAPLSPTTQTVSDQGSSGGGLLNILLGLLLGKLLGNISNTAPDLGKVLGASSGSAPTLPAGATTGGSAIIATAQRYMGVPYVWGGETPSGFDCSGFTQYVMNQSGITIPRTAEEQFATGTSVDKSSLQAGDLVFFTTYKPGASHVGFYMGDGNFIHASSAAGKVAISALDEEYYVAHYIGARRYTK